MIFQPNFFLHKEQCHTNHTDDCSNDLSYSDFLVEEKGCRGDNEDRRKRKDSLGDTGGGVKSGHQ